MGKYIDFVQELHSSTKRDYVARVVEFDKADSATVAKQWGRDYWDGDRQYGYGGYSYDGRWLPIAEKMAAYYDLKPGDKILDVGSGKGFLLYEFTQAVPGVEVAGIDISEHGVADSKEEVRDQIQVGNAIDLAWEDNTFDFVVSFGTLHNLPIQDLKRGVQEIERVGKGAKKHIMLESWRNEREKANLLYWQLTCESFHSVDSWKWLYDEWGYTGDYSFIFFE